MMSRDMYKAPLFVTGNWQYSCFYDAQIALDEKVVQIYSSHPLQNETEPGSMG